MEGTWCREERSVIMSRDREYERLLSFVSLTLSALLKRERKEYFTNELRTNQREERKE